MSISLNRHSKEQEEKRKQTKMKIERRKKQYNDKTREKEIKCSRRRKKKELISVNKDHHHRSLVSLVAMCACAY